MKEKTYKASAKFIDMAVEVSTTGFCGGEGGHGGCTTLKIINYTGSSCIEAAIDRQEPYDVDDGVEITVRGDWELEDLMKSLAFALEHLRQVTGEPVLINDHFRLSRFHEYLNVLVKNYHDGNRSLKGISRLAREYKTSHITIPQFFQFDLDHATCVDLERTKEIYEEITGKEIDIY